MSGISCSFFFAPVPPSFLSLSDPPILDNLLDHTLELSLIHRPRFSHTHTPNTTLNTMQDLTNSMTGSGSPQSLLQPQQDMYRRSKPADLPIASQTSQGADDSLAPLKSPRGHLLDRIRTPRRFIPQSIRESEAAKESAVRDDSRRSSTSAASPVIVNQSQRRASSFTTGHRSSISETPREEQLLELEQQLREQTSILMQQKLLLQRMQAQQHYQQIHSSGNSMQAYIASPPYTPNEHAHHRSKSLQFTPTHGSVVFDPVTRQYYTYTQPQPASYIQCNVTQAPKSAPFLQTPESILKKTSTRAPTPPKEGQPSRQPKGPPQLDLLISTNSAVSGLNFASRTRKRATKILEMGLLRRQTSPGPLSPKSQPVKGSHSMASIDEAFPALSIVQ